MRPLRAIATLLALATLALLAPRAVGAQELVVTDGEQDVVGGVLRIGRQGGRPCVDPGPPGGPSSVQVHGNFELRNAGSRDLTDIQLGATDLVAPAGRLEGARVQFAPAGIGKLNPRGRKTVTVKVKVPPGTPAGTYRGSVKARSGEGAEVELAVELVVCGGTGGGRLSLVEGAGDYDATGLHLRGLPDCAGESAAARFAVAWSGSHPLGGVRGELRGFPPGVRASFDPPAVDLAPGGRAELALGVALGGALEPGRHTGTLVMRDGSEAFTVEVPVDLLRCERPKGALRIVLEPGRGGLTLAPLGSCAGDRFSADVVVENIGTAALEAVRLDVHGLPGGLAVSLPDGARSLAPGARTSFAVAASGAAGLAPGSYRGSLRARDEASGAAHTVVLALERCAGDGDPEDPEDPEDPDDPRDPDTHDPGKARLGIEHRVSRRSVRVGEVLTFDCRISNLGTGPVRNLTLDERLPRGIVPVAGRTALDGAAWSDPEPGPVLRFRLPDLAAGNEARLAFQAVVTPAAEIGTARAEARARGYGVEAGPALVELEVTRLSRQPFGAVRGRVRLADGTPRAGVKLYLDSGLETASGEDGRFEFPGVPGGDHLVALDERSLGPGERAVGETSRELRLFEGSTEEVEFVLQGPPRLGVSIGRLLAGGTEP